jgi:hypothetical protein
MNELTMKYQKIRSIIKYRVTMGILMALLTLFLGISAWQQSNLSEQRMRVENFRQTQTLCTDFNKWYWTETDETNNELNQLKIWIGTPVTNENSSWSNLSDNDKIEIMKRNKAVYRLFVYFEDAKMLNKEGVLHIEYFYNFFVTTIDRLENAENPTVYEYLESERKDNKEVWDGYEYCRDIIKNYKDND